MSPAEPAMIDEAAAWVVRTRDPAFRDWGAFTCWLEADPAHNEAYETALDAHDAAGGLAPAPVAAASAPMRRGWRPAWAGAAAAAVLVAVVSTPMLLPRHDWREITTRPGEHRSVRLADGTQVALNGDTRLRFDDAHPRAVELLQGEANFTVVHDAADPFAVTAGGTRIEDVGTVFNVRRGHDATDVGVSEGSVVYDPRGARVKLAAGGVLHDPDRGITEIATADPAEIGAWRTGRLVFRQASLATVAIDLSRTTGLRVSAAPEIAARMFSGTIQFRGVPQSALLARVGALTGTRVARHGDGWRLSGGGAPL